METRASCGSSLARSTFQAFHRATEITSLFGSGESMRISGLPKVRDLVEVESDFRDRDRRMSTDLRLTEGINVSESDESLTLRSWRGVWDDFRNFLLTTLTQNARPA